MEALEIKQKFQKRKLRQFIVSMTLLFIMAFDLFIIQSEKDTLLDSAKLFLLAMAGGVMILGVIFSLINWRCPSCKSYLGNGGSINPKKCSNCNVEF
ncbi:MAG: hypothetical protein MI922_25910 [Bacteroidales bacterium]|nr:hypothetical protein [Bacteroidales bacterium]